MKGLKKIALATAVAAAPFAAQAELKALDDSMMSNVTGQAGVTIELQTRVEIGEFKYTDEGSFVVSGIDIGGETIGGGDANKNNLDDLALQIDVADDGDAVIHVTALKSALGVIDQQGTTAQIAEPIDFGVAVDTMSLRAQGATDNSNDTVLLSNLKLHGDLAALDIRVDTTGDGDGGTIAGSGVADSLRISTKFDIDNLDVDVPFMAVGIKGMVITGVDGSPEAVNENGTMTQDPNNTPSDPSDDVTLVVPAKDYASVTMDIYKGQAQGALTTNQGVVTGTDNVEGDALIIDIANVEMDVYIQDVVVGGQASVAQDVTDRSIGSIALDDLRIYDTKLAVYGHQ